jgi:hypothetical protein
MVCTLVSGKIQRKHLQYLFPPKLHLLLFPWETSSNNIGGQKNCGKILWYMKLEVLMMGKGSKTVGTCSELARTCFMVGKTKLQSKFLREKGLESE